MFKYLFAAAVVLAVARAGVDSESPDDDDVEEREREVELDVQDYEAEFKLKSADANREDELKYRVDLRSSGDGKAEVRIEYESETNQAESEIKYRILFEKLVEFTDTNGDGKYTPGDNIVSTKNLEGSSFWTTLTSSTEDSNGVTIYVVTATAADGSIVLDVHSAGTVTTDANGVILTPETVKIDVTLDLSWRTDANNKVALLITQRSDNDVEYEDGDDDTVVTSNADGVQGLYQWVTTASSAGVPDFAVDASDVITISADTDSEEGEVTSGIWYTFQTPAGVDTVSWDPWVGVNKNSINSAASVAGSLSLVAGAVLAALALAF